MPSRSEVKLSWSNRELNYISFFEGTTNMKAIDCLVTDDDRAVFFLLKPEDAEKMRQGCRILIQHLAKKIGKTIRIVEFHDDPKMFIRRALYPAQILEVQIGNGVRGGRVAYVTVSDIDKGKAIGKNGFKIQCIREIAKRHFGLTDIKIK
ncbi:MAG: NusA-like transcription termination signal-binding factor [Thermoproteota archaeon]